MNFVNYLQDSRTLHPLWTILSILHRAGSRGSVGAWQIHNQKVAGSNPTGGDMFSDQKHILYCEEEGS